MNEIKTESKNMSLMLNRKQTRSYSFPEQGKCASSVKPQTHKKGKRFFYAVG
jgi:hypothetical protein